MIRFLLLFAVATLASAQIPLDQRRSGYDLMRPETRKMQDDDISNPGMLWVLEGQGHWNRKAGEAQKSCADCHGDARESMKGVAARHPAWDAKAGRLFNVDQRINACRVERQQAPALAYEGRELLALSTLVGRQSRGMPAAVAVDGKARPSLDAGAAAFARRMGQLNLSCAQCHDDNWGRSLAGNTVPQAHPTGYPIYRLEWQTVGSLQRRLRNCMIGIRAEPYQYGAPEYVELEYYLMWRARGMRLETPGVRP